MEVGTYGSPQMPMNNSAALTFGLRSKFKDLVCIPQTKLACKGIFHGDNPFKFVGPLFLAQLAVSSFLTSACCFLLRPLFQTAIVGQILGGIIAGPSVLGRNEAYMETIFQPKSKNVLETLSLFSCMLYLFLVGVRMDVGIVKRSRSREWAIGILTYVLPQLLSLPVTFLLRPYDHENFQVDSHSKIKQSDLRVVAIFTSMTSFHVISCILHDLKLLNTELGRIAGASSMISGTLSWISVTALLDIKPATEAGLGILSCLKFFASMVVTVILIVFAIRPLLIWMIRQTPEGKPIKEAFVNAVIVLLLLCGFLSQLVGQGPFFVPMALGMVVPDGPPLGSTVVDKIDYFTSYILLPLYFLAIGEQVHASGIKASTWFSVGILTSIASLGKFIGTVLPCLYFQMPLQESLSLALILCSKATLFVLVLGSMSSIKFLICFGMGGINTVFGMQFINNPSFNVMCMTTPIMTGIISFTVKAIYDPSRRYLCYRRRTIEDTKHHSELRILVGVNNQESVPAIINILEASNPTRESPMGVYVLNLFDLVGRASPLLIAHDHPQNKVDRLSSMSNTRPTYTQRIINAFRIFESNNKGTVFMQAYTCIAPYATMHDDICTLALEKCTSFLILPFHKFWSNEGVMVDSGGLRNVNKQVLSKSPCSVGILVVGGAYGMPRSIHDSWSFYHIAVIFFGGADDREALIYAIRMADHPNVKLIVIRLIEAKSGITSSTIGIGENPMERKLDEELIDEFRSTTLVGVGCNRVSYVEKFVTDSLDIINVIQSMDDSYDLILVGRRHESGSYIFRGLTDQAKFPELGPIGDILASRAFKSLVSVLIMQQHTLTGQLNNDGVSFHMQGPSLILDVSSSCRKQ